jgi:integrase
MEQKTINKRLSTNEEGIFYKSVVNEKNKEIDKVFIIRYREDHKDKLKTIGKYSQGIRINYCKQIRNDILNKIRLGEETPSIIKKKKSEIINFNKFAEVYFLEKEDEVKDIEKIKRSYAIHIKPYLGHIDVEKIDVEIVKKIQREKRKILAERTVSAIIQIIGAIFNMAIKKKLFFKMNPIQGQIKRIQVDNKREKYLTLNEIKILLEETKTCEYLYLFVQIALKTGARVGTILSSCKKDVNLETNSITLKDHKNNSSYTGFYDDELKELLRTRMNNINVNDKLIGKSRQVIQDRLTKIYNKYFNQGLEKDDRKNRVVTHTLRHTFASHLAINGTPIYTIQKLMNHKDITMTLRYAKLAPDSGKDMVQGLYK